MALELMSPAGSLESAMAAIAGGADAIYFGAGDFNARRSAKNISALYALEKEEAAFFYLKENLAAYESRVMPLHQDGLAPGPEADRLDLILCNPPYLTGEDMESLQTEVRYEPPSALDGGEDGLDFYRRLTAVWKDRLVPGGLLAYEIGMGQQEDVSRILTREGLEQIHWKEDLSGIVRVVAGRKPMQ